MLIVPQRGVTVLIEHRFCVPGVEGVCDVWACVLILLGCLDGQNSVT